jgi:transposase
MPVQHWGFPDQKLRLPVFPSPDGSSTNRAWSAPFPPLFHRQPEIDPVSALSSGKDIGRKDSQPSQVPEDTARIARAVFKKGNRYLLLRDTFGDFFDSDDFRPLFHAEGRPAVDPAQLALITLVRFAENLSDERAADAVRARTDLKYLLALPLDHPGFDATVLCEFRTRLVEGHLEHLLFERLLARFRAQRLLRARGQQRTDSTHVLAAVRSLNRASLVGETFRHALNVLAMERPLSGLWRTVTTRGYRDVPAISIW